MDAKHPPRALDIGAPCCLDLRYRVKVEELLLFAQAEAI
jgi:hypothetical protein